MMGKSMISGDECLFNHICKLTCMAMTKKIEKKGNSDCSRGLPIPNFQTQTNNNGRGKYYNKIILLPSPAKQLSFWIFGPYGLGSYGLMA